MKCPSLLSQIATGVIVLTSTMPTEHPATDLDRTPFRTDIKNLLNYSPEVLSSPPLLQQEEQKAPKQKEIEFRSAFTQEDFHSVPNGVMETLEHPPENSSTMQIFSKPDGQLLAETIHHLDEEGFLQAIINEKKNARTSADPDKDIPKSLQRGGAGGFILQSALGKNHVVSITSVIAPSSEIMESKAMLLGLHVAGIKGEHVDRCPNDPYPLKPLPIHPSTNQEIIGQECEIDGVGSNIVSVRGKVFPMIVERVEEGKVTKAYTLMMLKLANEVATSSHDFVGLYGAPVRLKDQPDTCAGACASLWKHEDESGTITWMLVLVGPDELRELSTFIDEGLPPVPEKEPEEEAPDYDS